VNGQNQLGSSSSVQLGSSSSVQLGSSSSGQLGSSSSGQPQAGSSSSAIQSGSSSLQQLQSDIGLGQQQPNQQILKAEVADAQSKGNFDTSNILNFEGSII
jgi:hypothetical protein